MEVQDCPESQTAEQHADMWITCVLEQARPTRWPPDCEYGAASFLVGTKAACTCISAGSMMRPFLSKLHPLQQVICGNPVSSLLPPPLPPCPHPQS